MNKNYKYLSLIVLFSAFSTMSVAQKLADHASSAESTIFTPDVPAGPVNLTLTQTNNNVIEIASQMFEALYTQYDSDAADDFIIPAGPSKVIVSVDIEGTPGQLAQGGTVEMNIYNDAGGIPGALVFNESFPSPGTASFTLNSTTCPPLAPGTYWLSIVADQDFLPNGQWFWRTSSDDLTGNQWAWQNPGGGFLAGCPTWTPAIGCAIGAGSQPGLNYVINLADAPAPDEIVPTMGEWGIMILGILFLIFGVVAVTQRKTKEAIA